jgi:hypothetical protein
MKMPNIPLKLDLLQATIKDLQQALNTGECTSVDLIEAYLVSRQIVHDRYTIAVATTRSLRAPNDSFLSPDAQAAIENNNHTGLKLHAVIETAPKESLLQIAQELDDQRRAGVSRSPYPAQTLSAPQYRIAKPHHVILR